MTLNHNGQGITLSDQLKNRGVTDGAALKNLLDSEMRDYTFAQTFPTGTHAMWLYYWLACYGIHPLNDVNIIVAAAANGLKHAHGPHVWILCRRALE